jgi:hypothetical protein
VEEVDFVKAKIGSQHEENASVSDISEHDAKEKWEGGTNQNSWVEFLISGHAISIYNFLESLGELICRDARWRLRINWTDHLVMSELGVQFLEPN